MEAKRHLPSLLLFSSEELQQFMCGVFAYKGNNHDASKLILAGLKTLEYRGYDSWGIATLTGKNTIAIEKHVGKIGNTKISLPKSSVGIGHTRWATHGGVTVSNAHPHYDCNESIAVLHNGIVENFQSIKNDLLKKHHKFVSQTDTEVIAHLIEEFSKKKSMLEAVKDTFAMLQGLNAIVVLDKKTGDIFAAKNGSPLVIGKGNDELFLASDVTGILPHTKDVIFLKDNELARLGKTVELFSLPSGKALPVKYEHVSWSIEQADRGKYRHFMVKEIHEQSGIVRNIADTYADQIAELAEKIHDAKGTFFIGAGTAYHACLAGVYLFSKIAKRHVNTAPASEFTYLEDFLTKKSLVIALSQSGETIDVIEPLTRAKEKGATIISLVNALGSTMYRMSDYKMLLGAGPEKAVASTKAYIAKLSILTMLSFALAGKIEEGRSILLAVAKEIQRQLAPSSLKKLQSLARKLQHVQHMYTIGRGFSFSLALEAALKIKEVSYIHTEGLAGGELKHGSIALIEKGTPCIVFAPSDETYDAIISNATEIKARGGYIIGVASKQSPIFDEWIEVKDTGVGAVMTYVIPMQILAYYLAVKKKLDPDKPRNLAKSVTVK